MDEHEFIVRGHDKWRKLSYTDRLYLMSYISFILFKHATEGGTYRHLIYDRLGFGADAYSVLQYAGLLDIHSLISGALKHGKETQGERQ